MITYKYSLLKDIKHTIDVLSPDWLQTGEENVRVFRPSIFRWVWLVGWLLTTKLPEIDEEDNYIIYFVSSGCWGEYRPGKNEIIICPYKVEKSPDGTLAKVIEHEIMHLKHSEADEMNYGEKEKYIESLVNKETADS